MKKSYTLYEPHSLVYVLDVDTTESGSKYINIEFCEIDRSIIDYTDGKETKKYWVKPVSDGEVFEVSSDLIFETLPCAVYKAKDIWDGKEK